MLSTRQLLGNLFVFDSLAVDPVVEGKTRSEQFYRGDSQGKKVLLMKPMNQGCVLFVKRYCHFNSVHFELCFCKLHAFYCVLCKKLFSCSCRDMLLVTSSH